MTVDLFVDGFLIGSPGGLQIADELTIALERTAAGRSMLVIPPARSSTRWDPIEYVHADAARPGRLGQSLYYQRTLPALLRTHRPRAYLALTGITSRRSVSGAPAIVTRCMRRLAGQ